MAKQYNISIIGSGNVAWHLAPALENAGHQIAEVYSRDLKHAANLSDRLYLAIPKTDLDFSKSLASVFIVSIKDDAIKQILPKIKLPDGSFIAHTSGSIDLEILNNFSDTAVFYPVQTFSKSKTIDFNDLPLCLEAGNKKTLEIFQDIARSLQTKIYLLDSEKRKALHLSAVFACNFTNHLLGIANYLLSSLHLTPSILHPIIAETINKAMLTDPFLVQTGPATRNDQVIISKHLKMLEDLPEYKKIYKVISESILKETNNLTN